MLPILLFVLAVFANLNSLWLPTHTQLWGLFEEQRHGLFLLLGCLQRAILSTAVSITRIYWRCEGEVLTRGSKYLWKITAEMNGHLWLNECLKASIRWNESIKTHLLMVLRLDQEPMIVGVTLNIVLNSYSVRKNELLILFSEDNIWLWMRVRAVFQMITNRLVSVSAISPSSGFVVFLVRAAWFCSDWLHMWSPNFQKGP